MSDEITITKIKSSPEPSDDIIEYTTVSENGNVSNAPEYLQFINLPVLNISERIQNEDTVIIKHDEPDNKSQPSKIVADEVECLLSDPGTSGVLDGHVIILHQGKQFLVRHDQIDENGEVVLDEQNAIDGLVFDDDETPSTIECDDDSNLYYRIDGRTGGSIGYDEEYLDDDEEVVERFESGDGEDASNDDAEFYENEEHEMTIAVGSVDGSAATGTEFSAERFLEQIWYGGGPGKRKQFAILKDGRIHIQEGVIDDGSTITVERHATNFDVAFENEIDGSVGEGDTVGSNLGITGRNLVTGQTISLDTFLSKIAARNKSTIHDDDSPVKIKQEPGLHSTSRTERSAFPKRLTVGHTSSGKKIVGKILQIKRPGRDNDEIEPFASRSLSVRTRRLGVTLMTDLPETIESDVTKEASTGRLVEPTTDAAGGVSRRSNANLIVARNGMDPLTKKTLCGLMDLETVQKNLIGRNLIVRNVHKKINRKTDRVVHKNIKYFKGSFERDESGTTSDVGASWRFVENDDVNLVRRRSDDGPLKVEDDVDVMTDGAAEVVRAAKDAAPDSAVDVGSGAETGGAPFGGRKVSVRTIEKINETLPRTLTITVTVIEDENGKKRTKVVIPELSKVETHCSVCDKFFRTAQHLRRHVKATHRPDEKSFQCDLCSKRFVDASTLTRHRRIHSGDKNHRCDLCSKAFNTAGSLKRHITVHNPNLRPLQCLTCLQRFTDESSLKKHMLLHTGIKPFECDVCYKRFVYHGDLNFHRKIHDPSKRFICDTCGKEFSRQSNLVRHLDIHKDNGNTFKCDICGITYNFMSSLTRHIVNNHMKDS